MLEFFRRYQKAFFIVITVVIIISFSFFGTFQAVHGRDVEDKVAFTAVDGTKVLTSELNDMVAFLSQDSYDTMFATTVFAGNALNDGVLAHDIIETGLAEVIGAPYLAEIGKDEQTKLDREKRYKPYEHPRAPFISAKQVWMYYAPDVSNNLTKLHDSSDAGSQEAFNARLSLFSAERRFPPAYLKQFLRYQESMHKWLAPDQNLPHYDLALFGYHGAQDWFGRRFLEIVSEFIINAAKFAESKGYTVSKEEVLGSLFRNCEASYREAASQNFLAAKSPSDYFQEQLRHLGMDQGRAVRAWSQILLFRRLFFDNADSVLASGESYEDFYKQLNEYVDIDLYQMPTALRLNTQKELQKCAVYQDAIAPQANKKMAVQFAMPQEILSVEEVKKKYPQLVEKGYLLRWKEANKESLQTKVGVKAMWEWQVKDENWETLKNRYPELAKGSDATQEERLASLDSMEPARRAMLDTFSRQEIVNQHPEWLKEALQNGDSHEETILVRQEGGKIPFTGVKDMPKFIELLQKSPLNEESEELSSYSQDGVHYYTITVLDASLPERIVSYDKAASDGTLDALLEKQPTKESLADFLTRLDQERQTLKENYPDLIDWNNETKARITSYLLPYVQVCKNEVRKEPENEAKWVIGKNAPQQEGFSADTYKLIKSRERLVRKDTTFMVDPLVAFSLPQDTQSDITSYKNNGLAFYQVISKGFLPSAVMVRQKVLEERALLGNDAICMLGQTVVDAMQKNVAPSTEEASSSTPESTS